MTLKLQQDKTERQIEDAIVKIVHRASLEATIKGCLHRDSTWSTTEIATWIAADIATWNATRTAVIGPDS